MSKTPLILQVDVTGNPQRWITHERAIHLQFTGHILADLGETRFLFKGGVNAHSHLQSHAEVSSIILVKGKVSKRFLEKTYVPVLNNRTLFRRDGHTCMYCGTPYTEKDLTRDHVRPVSRGGKNTWTNVVTACRRCNNHKGARTPEEWGAKLLAVPFTPNRAEYLFLQNRRIIADQQEFLAANFRNYAFMI